LILVKSRSRSLDREFPINSCGHVVEACRVVSPAPGASSSHLCDLATSASFGERSSTDLGAPTRQTRGIIRRDGQIRDRVSRMGNGGYLSEYTRSGSRRFDLLDTAGTYRTGFARFTTSGSTDPPIQVLACGAHSPCTKNRQATTTRIGRARARPREKEKEEEREKLRPPPTGRR
jgi:hypothetical protein